MPHHSPQPAWEDLRYGSRETVPSVTQTSDPRETMRISSWVVEHWTSSLPL